MLLKSNLPALSRTLSKAEVVQPLVHLNKVQKKIYQHLSRVLNWFFDFAKTQTEATRTTHDAIASHTKRSMVVSCLISHVGSLCRKQNNNEKHMK